MKFQLAINLERMDDSVSMEQVRDHTLEMVQLADRAGFSTVWAAEHHALEMTIAPNPFLILAWLAANTERIRLGTGVVNAAYWHPIRLAGEAAFLDLVSGGRLEFGIGSGAYQREFDRMRPGLVQSDAWRYMQEMLPAVKALWAGDYEHDGEFWQFPRSTSAPKPLQKPHPPLWVAARAPITYEYAVANGCNVMAWPLTRDISEAELYMQRLEEALAAHPGARRPKVAMMRHTAIYTSTAERDEVLKALRTGLGMFGNLMQRKGDVVNGFPDAIALEELDRNDAFAPAALEANLAFGSPAEVTHKIKQLEAIGVDEFIYYASMGLGHDLQKRSLTRFCEEVMPAFA